MNLRLDARKLTHIKSFGDSMHPLLRDGDIVYFKKAPFSSIKHDDIIVVSHKKHCITHRVIYKTDSYVITKGDNNPYSDGKIKPNRIIGRVHQIQRGEDIFPVDALSLVQNAAYLSEIDSVVNLFAEKRIDYVFLKGLPLYLYYANQMPKRIYADCDLLVAEKDIDRARRMLVNNAYECPDVRISPLMSTHRLPEEAYYKIINSIPVVLDVHRMPVFMLAQVSSLNALYPDSLLHNFTNALLRTKRTVVLRNVSYPILSTPYLIVYLALHLFHHNFRGAYRYHQMAQIVFKEMKVEKQLWDEIHHICETYELKAYVMPVFAMLRKYYHIPVPVLFKKEVQIDIRRIDIFSDQTRLDAGIERIILLWKLSPRPLWRKLFIVCNTDIVLLFFATVPVILVRLIKSLKGSGPR